MEWAENTPVVSRGESEGRREEATKNDCLGAQTDSLGWEKYSISQLWWWLEDCKHL